MYENFATILINIKNIFSTQYRYVKIFIPISNELENSLASSRGLDKLSFYAFYTKQQPFAYIYNTNIRL